MINDFKKATTSLMLCALVVGLLATSSCTAQRRTITILHTNDLHASFLPHEAAWMPGGQKPLVGGFKELWWTVDSIRRAKTVSATLLLDGGDVMTGSPISEMDYNGSTGGALFEMMNRIGYDAWTVGNHDLDISQDNLRQHAAIAKFPTLGANMQDSLGQLAFHNQAYTIVNKGDIRIGIIGMITKDLFTVTNTNNLKGMKVLSPVDIAQKIIDSLTKFSDLIVALTHEGVDDDSALAASTHGLNVIIGAHSHTRLKSPKEVNGVVICQAGSNCENLGELELTVEQKKVTQYSGKLLQLWVHPHPENDFTKFVDEYRVKVDAEYGEVLGTLTLDWKREGKGESNIGNFVADAIREAADADIGITNSTGIRKDLPAGPIRKLDLFEVSPFRNVLCTFTLSAGETREFVQRYLNSVVEGKGSTQHSGLSCQWKRVDGKAVIDRILVEGKELQDDRLYTWATHDFLINQADKYLGIRPVGARFSPTTVLQALVAKVRNDKTITSRIENRMKEIQ